MRNKIFATLGILSLAVVGITSPAVVSNMQAGVNLAPGECVEVVSGDTVINICRNSVGVTSTATALPTETDTVPNFTPTETLQPPTDTPTATLQPTDTNTPSQTPLPTSTRTPTMTRTVTPTHDMGGGHDTTVWHAPMDGHEHGDNPNAPAIVALFGSAGSYWNQGTTRNIGVPFETSPIENVMKHANAKYYTMTSQQIDAAWEGAPFMAESSDNGGNPTTNRIRAWRILAHGGANLMEAMGNNHSFFAEVQVCTRGSSPQCGIIRTGGWMFWGRLQAPFYNQVHQRPGGSITFPGGMTMTFNSDPADLAAIGSPNTVFDEWGGEPYWFMFPRTMPDGFDSLAFARANPGLNIGDQLSSNEVGPQGLSDCAPFPTGSQCGNRLIHLAIRIFDGWNLLDTSNVNNPVFICTQISPSNCTYNGTLRGMKEVDVYIDPNWDQASFDTDSRPGFVTMTRFTDRYQRLRPIGACSVIGVDCVPLVLTNVPVGYAAIKLKIQEPVPGIDREYQTPGVQISFPN